MTHRFRLCRVEAATGHAGPGEPRRFQWEGRWREVELIDDRWYEGGVEPEAELVLYFRVTSEEGRFILRFLPYFRRWQVAAAGED